MASRCCHLEQIKKAEPGRPLDYDPRLGVTREEWAEYLREAENRHLASTGHPVVASGKCVSPAHPESGEPWMNPAPGGGFGMRVES